mgnify:CR=1 FL=1
MTYFTAVILGFVQGITEFLPVSSTGHLILARSVLGSEGTHALAFDALLHLATAAAVILYFRRDMWALVQTFLRYVGRMPVNARDVTLLFAIIAGTIPAAIVGFFLESLMDSVLRGPLIVAGSLIVGSLLLGSAEYVYRRKRISPGHLTVRIGAYIGLFQMLALIPGMSRSGSSISGGILLGLSRTEATRFAFLLSVPVILGAGLKKGVALLSQGADVSLGPVFVGAMVAFISGLCAVHFMLRYLRTHTFWPFIWYRFVLAAVVILVVFAG